MRAPTDMHQLLNEPVLREAAGGTHAFEEHLRENEKELIRHNIVVRVESIHQAHRTAMCTVRQRNDGLLRRERSAIELIWRAEQALAPLLTMGISPMVQVQHRQRGPLAVFGAGPWNWMRRLAQRLGYPITSNHEPRACGDDPFGWRGALDSTHHTVAASKTS